MLRSHWDKKTLVQIVGLIIYIHKFLFYNKFIIFLYTFRAPCAYCQEVNIVLYSI